LTSQLISFDALAPELKNVAPKDNQVEEKKYDAENLDDFFRFSAEEILRRQAKRDALPLTKA
jgi:hypothetical protein